ncbi:hypothetical protein [Streptomyces griseocarneus]|uniref:hypothetical protein n=1 Tax=Streptomyces griseocarneus TaxID=51201 RepID=UPI0019C52029|nr:hypothetical protein GCM10018779_05180 [Streptomyces griseocarneus]
MQVQAPFPSDGEALELVEEEPAERTLTAAQHTGARVVAPRPGQPFEPAVGLPLEPWWRAVAAPAAGGGEPPAEEPETAEVLLQA